MEIIAATENPLFQHITSANLDYAVCNVAQLQCWYENGSKKAWEIFRSGRWLRFREPQQCNLSIKPAPYPFIAEYQRLSALERGTRLARGYSLSASVAEGRLLYGLARELNIVCGLWEPEAENFSRKATYANAISPYLSFAEYSAFERIIRRARTSVVPSDAPKRVALDRMRSALRQKLFEFGERYRIETPETVGGEIERRCRGHARALILHDIVEELFPGLNAPIWARLDYEPWIALRETTFSTTFLANFSQLHFEAFSTAGMRLELDDREWGSLWASRLSSLKEPYRRTQA